jgi:hypothetical protein
MVLKKVFFFDFILANQPYLWCSLRYRKTVSPKYKKRNVKTQKANPTVDKTDGRSFSGYGKPIGFGLGFDFPLGSNIYGICREKYRWFS